ncbi:hypothetical protein [Salinibacter ruber]|uniref:Uncharacterized protein n=1 Tax=Salinibacter ruber TaxID=146919 RepID=A0A9X2U6I0_9BACT|nr:hypothetical protein [Salinibacter ruber]MCS3655671.1 hypothetical protein [Salinibacter ruber]MCS3950818.1 hypothetical protein [Salinibacter ruber]MCS4116830.1 hypothetical protein [Salinibacter ruber]MCS4152751.1 hypothetical protein [Salinibacter ruber]MCS4168564.1 hypothetical protein [Salinibacter ruber]
MSPALLSLILSALLTIGGIVAVVLIVQTLRRIARSHERSVALLEDLIQQQRTEDPDSSTHDDAPPSAS